jgi:hypothetical protein
LPSLKHVLNADGVVFRQLFHTTRPRYR